MTIDETPFVVLVHPSLPVNSVKELVDYAKAASGQAQLRRVGRRVVRASARRAVPARDRHASIVFVPYVDGGATLRGLLTNEIQVAFDTLPGSIAMIEGGKLRLARRRQPGALVPRARRADDEGGRLLGRWSASGSPPTCASDTPPAIVDKLARALKEAAQDPKVSEQYRKLGFETVGDGPQETVKRLREETEMWRKTIEAAGIKAS